MFILDPELNTHIETIQSLNYSEKPIKGVPSQPAKPPFLLQAIIEGLVDGVLILTQKGEWVHANERARRVCNKISQSTPQSNSVPEPIWRVCESLIASRELFPEQKMIIDSEINMQTSGAFRIRVQWLELNEKDAAYLLVTLEDRGQSSQNIAIADAQKYGLTPREAEVWLLRRSNHSYQEIADKLYITLNTVKKHMKNIYAKQQGLVWAKEPEVVSACHSKQAC
jgi:DNA-binding CsgD family transcriptional regulator